MLTSDQRLELAALERLQDHVEPLEDFVARIAPKLSPVPWHLQRVFDLFERSRFEEIYATISMPPRHGKSTGLQLGLAWRTLYDPACLNFYATFGANLAMASSRKIRKLVRLAGVPLSAEVQNVNEWETIFGGGLKATSMAGDVTGRGSNGGIVVGDDLIKGRKQAESKLLRDTAWNWLRDDYMSRLEPGASMIINATRWHDDDPIGRLLEDPLGVPWQHLSLPAIRNAAGMAIDEREEPGGIPLWPGGGYDLIRLARIRMRGEHGWWSLYQQQPAPRGGGMFRGRNFHIVDEAPRAMRTIRRWDLAASEERESAFTAGVKVSLVDGKIFVLDVRRGQWEADKRDQQIVDTAADDGRTVEIWLPQDPGQAGKSQKPHYGKLLHGYRIYFDRESTKKELRADPYASQVGAGNVYLVHGAWNRAFVEEHEMFPAGRIKDQVDAMSGAYFALIVWPTSAPDHGGYSGDTNTVLLAAPGATSVAEPGAEIDAEVDADRPRGPGSESTPITYGY